MNSRRWILGLFLGVFACSPVWEEADIEVATSQGAIFGGVVNTQDAQVFMLIMRYPNGGQGSCTATLIAPRTLLTAAHCVDPRIENQTSVQIWAHNKTSVNSAGPNDFIQIVETRIHPEWNPNDPNLGADIAIARLATPAAVQPKPWNSASVSGFGGKPLRALGYGLSSSNPSSSGTRREVALTFEQVTPRLIILGDQNGKGVCSGDSGGPSFHTFSDGVERVVGVHSFTVTQDCDYGADTRVDVYASFINDWLTAKEAPTCQSDGRCKTGCTPVDQDCVCVADGTCNPQCLNVLLDPDCPKDCAQDGVCSLAACPSPDKDCAQLGDACSSELVCPSRLCISDPQSKGYYCSVDCINDASCSAGMECSGGLCKFIQKPVKQLGEFCTAVTDFCAGNAVCTGKPNETTSCETPCTTDSDCAQGATCEAGVSQTQFCRRPLIEIGLANASGPSAASCATTGGTPWLWGLFAWLGLALSSRRGMQRHT